MRLVGWLRRLADPFRPVEWKILQAVSANLSAEARDKFQRQLRCINKVQRLSQGKEVNLYSIRGGVVLTDDEARFPNAQTEVMLAAVKIRTTSKERVILKAEVWLVRGRVFSLMFDKPPPPSAENLLVYTVEIRIDPMIPVSDPVLQTGDPVFLPEWVKQWQVSDVIGPIPAGDRIRYSQQIETELPSDYVELTTQANGLKVDSWRIYGLTDVRKVVDTEADYYVLAEAETTGIVAVIAGKQPVTLCFLSYEGESPRLLGSSFRGAMEEVLRMK